MAAKKHNMFRSKARLAFNVQEAQVSSILRAP